MKDLLQYSFHVSGPSLVQPEMRCMNMAGHSDMVSRSVLGSINTYVIPFPNQEWVSSWTTTSTKDLSPVSSAETDQAK